MLSRVAFEEPDIVCQVFGREVRGRWIVITDAPRASACSEEAYDATGTVPFQANAIDQSPVLIDTKVISKQGLQSLVQGMQVAAIVRWSSFSY